MPQPMVLAEKIGPGGQYTVYDEYFPSLAVLDTEEILDRVRSTWKNPGASERHSMRAMDEILLDWVRFCDEALKGHQIVVNVKTKGIISGDSRSFESFIIFRQAIDDKEKIPEVITSVRSAFIELLSDGAKKTIVTEEPTIYVDDVLRATINQLVENVGFLADQHFAIMHQKLVEFEND